MSREHRVFAAELRADALNLRIMAESLDLRAAEQDRLAEIKEMERAVPAGGALVAPHQLWPRRLSWMVMP